MTASSVLPYEIKLDGSYGVLGGVLIVTGAPVCVLGGKNRWSVATSCSVNVARSRLQRELARATGDGRQPPKLTSFPRRTSLFLLYFYAGAFVTLVLAVQFGVAVPDNPPSATMRGVFVLVGAVVGGLAGAVAVLVAGWSRYGLTFIGGWSVAWWILSFGQGGLIDALWGRWVLFAGAFRPCDLGGRRSTF